MHSVSPEVLLVLRGVMLRNEAWLDAEDLVPLLRNKDVYEEVALLLGVLAVEDTLLLLLKGRFELVLLAELADGLPGRVFPILFHPQEDEPDMVPAVPPENVALELSENLGMLRIIAGVVPV